MYLRTLTLFLVTSLWSAHGMGMDVDSLWDYSNPQLSERRFLDTLNGLHDQEIILKTQIARSYGLRGDFAHARSILSELEPGIAKASPEARARYQIELGRTMVSAAHPADSLKATDRAAARAAVLKAASILEGTQLDSLRIDAWQMLAIVETDPAKQLKWLYQALSLAESSTQATAAEWQAALLHSTGLVTHQQHRYDEALYWFTRAEQVRRSKDNQEATWISSWMVGWTLRYLDRTDEALQTQTRLEQERQVAGKPSPFVYDELVLLYKKKGNQERADFYTKQRSALKVGS
jgi:hypothetical protein